MNAPAVRIIDNRPLAVRYTRLLNKWPSICRYTYSSCVMRTACKALLGVTMVHGCSKRLNNNAVGIGDACNVDIDFMISVQLRNPITRVILNGTSIFPCILALPDAALQCSASAPLQFQLFSTELLLLGFNVNHTVVSQPFTKKRVQSTSYFSVLE
jgi:hypothetical protein